MIGVGLSIVQLAVRQMLGGGAFTPATLFANSEPGVWYDPSDLTTLFQDSAGTTPVTAVEQPVGLMLDKSGRGFHATQTTSTSRPVLSARYNLLTNTETLSTQSVTTQATNYKLRFTGTGTITLSGTKTGVYTAGTHTLTGVTAGTLTVTVAGVATTVDLRPANLSASLPAYQRVNTATDYDTTGFPKYLRFDGIDDWMVTPTITPGIDRVQVFAGVRKLSDAPGSVVGFTASPFTTAGSFELQSGDSTTGTGGAFYSFLGTNAAGRFAAFTNPYTSVLCLLNDLTQTTLASELLFRLNSTDVALGGSVGTQQSSTAFANSQLFIGRRGNGSIPLNGNLHSLIVRFGANLDITTIEQTENWVNGKTGAWS